MSGIPESLNAKTSTTSKNYPEAYWIIYDQEVHNTKHQLNEQFQERLPQLNSHKLTQTISTPACKKQVITSILTNISKEYATQRFLNFLSHDITKDKIEQIINIMEKQFVKFKLTKRNLVFSIIIPRVSSLMEHHISCSPYFSKMIKFYSNKETQGMGESSPKISSPQNSPRKLKMSRKASIIMGCNIFVDLQKSEQEIQQELIKQMKLDFIWLGVVSRLGADVEKFTQAVIDEEQFTPQYIGFYDNFFNHLNQLLYNHKLTEQQSSQLNNQLTNQLNEQPTAHQSPHPKPTTHLLPPLLTLSHKHASHQNQSINTITQQLIRSKFNSRIIISDILSTGDYLTLLTSRNYFNLLYIESDTLLRFTQFRNQCQNRFQHVSELLDIQTFLIIDDYWYRNFVLKCLPHVKFIIDRATEAVSYSDVITKNYKQIIPSYRPNFDQYFLSICNVLKQRSGCLKQAVGSIIVKDKRIISTGYNGTPIDCINCFNGGCKVCNNSQKMNTQVLSCTCIHAQYGCILQAGIKITPGSTLYSTKLPCLWCCKLIVQGRISKIVYLKSKYPHLEYQNISLAKQILSKAKIQLVQIDSTKTYISV